MGSTTMLLAVLAVMTMISYVDAVGGSCPQPSKVYGCSPKCVNDNDCRNSKVCCPNACNTKSCSEPSQYGSNDKYSHSGATGTYCGNVKCNSFEVCKQDRATGRMKCSRP